MAVVNTHWIPETGLQLDEAIGKNDRDGVQNLFRYWWAQILIEHADPHVAWDLGCGCGYGTRVLTASQTSQFQVFAYDQDDKALQFAQRHMNTARTKFARMDLNEPFTTVYGQPPQPVPFVVCFHVIEFLRHRDIFLENVAQAMQGDGIFLVSTPFRQNLDTQPEWDQQKILFTRDLFIRLMKRYFKTVLPIDNDEFPGRGFQDVVHRKLDGKYQVGEDLLFCQFPIQ